MVHEDIVYLLTLYTKNRQNRTAFNILSGAE